MQTDDGHLYVHICPWRLLTHRYLRAFSLDHETSWYCPTRSKWSGFKCDEPLSYFDILIFVEFILDILLERAEKSLGLWGISSFLRTRQRRRVSDWFLRERADGTYRNEEWIMVDESGRFYQSACIDHRHMRTILRIEMLVREWIASVLDRVGSVDGRWRTNVWRRRRRLRG